MRESFTIVDHTNSNTPNYIYGNADSNEVNYPGEKKNPICYKIRHYIISSIVAFTIIGVATVLSIKYTSNLDGIQEENLQLNAAEGFNRDKVTTSYSLLHKKNDIDKLSTQNASIMTLSMFNIDLMKYLIEPLKYEIFIHVNSNSTESSSFYGNVSIEFVVKKRVKYIVIGASDLGLVAVTVTNLQPQDDVDINEKNRKNIPITVNSFNTEKGILVIKVNNYLESSGRYLLQVEYDGTVNYEPHGIFKVFYSSPRNKIEKTLIGANTAWPFERTIFPCFGSPTQTAIFVVNICREVSFTTVSSSPYSSSIPDSRRDCVWDRFSPTDRIPTHALGFVVTDYPKVQMTMENGIAINIWHPVAQNTVIVAYLLDWAPKLMNAFEDYFGVRCPSDTVNIFCVPAVIPHIPAKLGIIFIPDVDLTTMEARMSDYQEVLLMRTLAAHIAKQWIDFFLLIEEEDRWIVESLNQYLEFVAIDMVKPEWTIFDDFLISVLHPEMDVFSTNPNRKSIVLSQPSYVSLYPVLETSVFQNHRQHWNGLQHISDEEEISPSIYSELFAARNIDKGICFFRMLQLTLSESIFRDSLKKFLEFGRGKIVTGNDLWNIMTAEVKNNTTPGYELLPPQMTLKVIVNEWISNDDLLILKVTRDYDEKTLMLEQIFDDRDENGRERKVHRHIPISYTTAEEKDFLSTIPKLWLGQTNQTFQNIDFTNDTWLLLNLQQTGLYRVNYDEKNWLMLKDSLEQGNFPLSVRAQLFDDALFLGLRGHMNYELALNLTRSLLINHEKEYVVWYTVLRHFEKVENMMVSVNDRTLNEFILMLKNYVKYIISSLFDDIDSGKTNFIVRDRYDMLLQAYIYRWACKVEENKCILKVREDFNRWRRKRNPDEENPINPNMRYATLCGMMYHADVSDFEFLFYRYLNTSYMNPNKEIYLKSLFCYNQIDRTISSILGETLLDEYSVWHLTEISNLWKALAENPILSTSPFDYMVKNWKQILKKYSDYIPILMNIIEGATVNISGEDQLKTVYQLKKDDSCNIENIQDLFAEVIKKTKLRITWKYHGLGLFATWLLKTSVDDAHKVMNNTAPREVKL